MNENLPVIAGTLSTIIFVLSAFPMLTKAARTRDLGSYSIGNILMANAGNVVHSVYVFHLPFGPIWLLHSFYLVSTALMLVWYLRYEWRPASPARLPVAERRRRAVAASHAVPSSARYSSQARLDPVPAAHSRLPQAPAHRSPHLTP